jgi:hypothetical protein
MRFWINTNTSHKKACESGIGFFFTLKRYRYLYQYFFLWFYFILLLFCPFVLLYLHLFYSKLFENLFGFFLEFYFLSNHVKFWNCGLKKYRHNLCNIFLFDSYCNPSFKHISKWAICHIPSMSHPKRVMYCILPAQLDHNVTSKEFGS